MTALRKTSSTFPLRLPPSLRSRIEKLAEADGISLNQYIAMTLAEKIGASQQRDFFAERQSRADMADLMVFLNREGGDPPREGDELPDGFMSSARN
jgi:hypothetical protein